MLVHFVVMELITRNEQVRIIIRSTASICFDLQHVEVFECDFTDYEVLKKAAFGCDAIVRFAAITATNLLYYRALLKTPNSSLRFFGKMLIYFSKLRFCLCRKP